MSRSDVIKETVNEDGTRTLIVRDKPIDPATKKMGEDDRKEVQGILDGVRHDEMTLQDFVSRALPMLEKIERGLPVTDPADDVREDVREFDSLQDIVSQPVDRSDSLTREICEVNDTIHIRNMAAAAVKRSAQRQNVRMPDQWAKPMQETPEYKRLQRLQRAHIERSGGRIGRANAYTPRTSGVGQEWAPQGVSRQYVAVPRLIHPIAARFPRIEIPDGVRELQIPAGASATAVTVRAPFSGANPAAPVDTSATVNNPSTGVYKLLPASQVTPYMTTSIEEIADATIAVVQALVMEGREALREAHIVGIVHGQTSADAGLDAAAGPTAANGYAVTDDDNAGLRVYSHVTNANEEDAGNGVCGIDHFENAWSSMDFYGLDVANCIAIGSAKCLFDLMKDSAVRPADAGLGTIRNGALASLYGIDLFYDSAYTGLNASGVFDGVTTTRTGMTIVNVSQWRVGFKPTMDINIIDADGEFAVNVRGMLRTAIGHAVGGTAEARKHTASIINVAA